MIIGPILIGMACICFAISGYCAKDYLKFWSCSIMAAIWCATAHIIIAIYKIHELGIPKVK